ncbi:hypothetical protein [Streptodolium elevatio]
MTFWLERVSVSSVAPLGGRTDLPVGPRLTVLDRDYGELAVAELPL